MNVIKCYKDYAELKESLENKIYDIMNDSIGQCNNDDYSVDVTVRDYDGNLCIDYDVYKCKKAGYFLGLSNKEYRYLDGGKVCDTFNMPETDKDFWELVEQRFKEHISK